MDELLNELQVLTEEVLNQLQDADDEVLLDFVGARGKIIDRMEQVLKSSEQSTMTEDQKRRLQDLRSKDTMVIERMTAIKDDAAAWLERRNQSKMQRSAYDMNITPDSILFDYKK